jgi:hypothetical protein
MVFVSATQTDFAEAGIPITTEIKIADKYIKHVEHLTASQMNAIRFDSRYEFLDEIPQGS